MSAELISTLLGSRVMAMSTVQKEQVRGVDQTPYQSWHSPLRWATSYAHEVAPLLLKNEDQRETLQKEPCDLKGYTHTHTPTPSRVGAARVV